jgi:helix-turn-helix protein
MTENTKKTIEIDPKALGQRIRTLRRQRGYTLAQMAELTGKFAYVLSAVERFARPVQPERIRRIAQALNVSLAYLLLGKDVPWSPSLEAALERCAQLSTRPCSCGRWKFQHHPYCERCEIHQILQRADRCRCGRRMTRGAKLCPECQIASRAIDNMVPCACGGMKAPTAKRCLACYTKATTRIDPANALRVYERLHDYRATGRALGCTHEAVRLAVAKAHIEASLGRS